jgi:hypothetical protein
MDDVDVIWNIALNEFETKPNDGQESYVGDESNIEGDGAMAQKPLFDNIYLVKSSVSTFDTTPTFVSSAIISPGGYELGSNA